MLNNFPTLYPDELFYSAVSLDERNRWLKPFIQPQEIQLKTEALCDIYRLVNDLDLRAITRSVSFIDKLSFDSLPILSSGDTIFTGTATESPVLLKVPLLDKKLQPKSETIDLEKIWFN